MKAFLFLAAASVAGALGTLLLLGDRTRQSVRGGCFVNFGTGCNQYITQTISTTDSATSALLVVSLTVVVVIGVLFLLVTRPRRGP